MTIQKLKMIKSTNNKNKVMKVTTINKHILSTTLLNSKINTTIEDDNINNKQINTTTNYTNSKFRQKKRYHFGVWTKSQTNEAGITQTINKESDSSSLSSQFKESKQTKPVEWTTYPPSWNKMIDKVSITTPIFNIIISTPSSISSITKNSIYIPTKKKKNRVNEYLQSWDTKHKEQHNEIKELETVDIIKKKRGNQQFKKLRIHNFTHQHNNKKEKNRE